MERSQLVSVIATWADIFKIGPNIYIAQFPNPGIKLYKRKLLCIIGQEKCSVAITNKQFIVPNLNVKML